MLLFRCRSFLSLYGFALCIKIDLICMLFTHVVDLKSWKASDSKGLFNGHTGMIRMDMYLYYLIISNYNKAVTYWAEIVFKSSHCGFRGIFYIYKEFCTVSECDALIVNWGKGSIFLIRGWWWSFLNLNLNIASDNLQRSLKEEKKSHSACVNNICLFKYRKHFLCLKQYGMSVLYNGLYKFCYVCCFVAVFKGALAHYPCHRKYSSFLRLHNGLISSLNGLCGRLRQCNCVSLANAFKLPGKSSEKLRSDNAWVSPCAS